jgi:hypothetical protein
MSTLLDEQPAAPQREPDAGREDQGAGPAAPGGPAGAPTSHPCPSCGAPIEPGQEWCLQCGAAAPGALERSPWRSTGLIVAVIAALALGAAAAAVAALNQQAPAARRVTNIVAAAPAATPPASTPAPAPKTTPPATSKAPLPTPAKHLPKLPTTTSTPPATPTTSTSTTGSGATGESQGSTGTEGATGEGSESAPQSSALLLDTDAASTYDPYNLPASFFGDPSLTIDGDNTTTWTAQVNPATAPSMAEGVLINLKSLKKLSALELVSPTKGMVVQVYGTAAATPPASITETSWVPLTKPFALKKTHTRFKLLKPKTGFRYTVVWISKAPPSAVGTPTAPGHVKVGEIEVFPASG